MNNRNIQVAAKFGTTTDSESTTFEVTAKAIALSFQKRNTETSISAYPNPTSGKVTIRLNSYNNNASLAQVKLCDNLGKELLSKHVDGSTLLLDLSAYPKGVYLIRASDSVSWHYHKIIIQ